ncbi:MAG TPA: hypothetical protein VMU17_08160, partial [Elusimicrobiota bacterium]|nr:hypothetical protein [Elusimicrobiota bacterium]
MAQPEERLASQALSVEPLFAPLNEILFDKRPARERRAAGNRVKNWVRGKTEPAINRLVNRMVAQGRYKADEARELRDNMPQLTGRALGMLLLFGIHATVLEALIWGFQLHPTTFLLAYLISGKPVLLGMAAVVPLLRGAASLAFAWWHGTNGVKSRLQEVWKLRELIMLSLMPVPIIGSWAVPITMECVEPQLGRFLNLSLAYKMADVLRMRDRPGKPLGPRVERFVERDLKRFAMGAPWLVASLLASSIALQILHRPSWWTLAGGAASLAVVGGVHQLRQTVRKILLSGWSETRVEHLHWAALGV